MFFKQRVFKLLMFMWICPVLIRSDVRRKLILPVSVNNNTPPKKKAAGKMRLQSTKSGAGYPFLPLDCRAKASQKWVFCSQTPVSQTPVSQTPVSQGYCLIASLLLCDYRYHYITTTIISIIAHAVLLCVVI